MKTQFHAHSQACFVTLKCTNLKHTYEQKSASLWELKFIKTINLTNLNYQFNPNPISSK